MIWLTGLSLWHGAEVTVFIFRLMIIAVVAGLVVVGVAGVASSALEFFRAWGLSW